MKSFCSLLLSFYWSIDDTANNHDYKRLGKFLELELQKWNPPKALVPTHPFGRRHVWWPSCRADRECWWDCSWPASSDRAHRRCGCRGDTCRGRNTRPNTPHRCSPPAHRRLSLHRPQSCCCCCWTGLLLNSARPHKEDEHTQIFSNSILPAGWHSQTTHFFYIPPFLHF